MYQSDYYISVEEAIELAEGYGWKPVLKERGFLLVGKNENTRVHTTGIGQLVLVGDIYKQMYHAEIWYKDHPEQQHELATQQQHFKIDCIDSSTGGSEFFTITHNPRLNSGRLKVFLAMINRIQPESTAEDGDGGWLFEAREITN